ncbi:hypothetical protein QUB19_03025 [Microcoleus sp. B4-C5]|uniref:hypothetical protein n=1 Tax=unclassified Microcoleus TaxID=2642155 RepID=UPI002FD28A89
MSGVAPALHSQEQYSRRVRRHQKSSKKAKISQRRTLQELAVGCVAIKNPQKKRKSRAAGCVAIKNPKKERKSRSDEPHDN